MNIELAINTSLLHSIPKQKQVQCSVADQLAALYVIANRFGLYDAADIIQQQLQRPASYMK
jgi:hypothetical protein